MSDGTSENRGPSPDSHAGSGSSPTHAHPRASLEPTSAQQGQSPSLGFAGTLFNGIANLIGVVAVIFFTFYFTTYFAKKSPKPAVPSEAERAAAKKIEELHAQERKKLTTYGVVNPALNTVRIPVDRAMELIAAESASPPAGSAPGTAVPTATPTLSGPATHSAPSNTNAQGTTASSISITPKEIRTEGASKPVSMAAASPSSTSPAPVAKPVVATPKRVGLAPEILYRAICIACHDVDGKGGIVRKAMPVIPDFTDPKWHLTRSDAELQHSMLEGKGQLMLPMKDKFALAKTDPKEMVAFIRRFQPGGAKVASTASATPAIATSVPKPGTTSTTTASTTSAAVLPSPKPSSFSSEPATATPPVAPTTVVTPANDSSAAALAMSTPLPPEALALLAPPPAPTPPPTTMSSTARRAPVSAISPEKLKISGELFRMNCAVCHGPDGKGVAQVRIAMAALPDFTSRAFQSSRDSAQLSISILDGKGTLMPPWRSKLTPDQARDLVSYVRNFGPADLLANEAAPSEFGNRYRSLKKQWDDLERQLSSIPRQ